MNLPKQSIFILIFILSNCAFAQYIQVDDTYTAQQLVEDVLIDSPCANVSNFNVSGDTFSGAEQSFGYFTSNGSDFPFTNGIVLSTARAVRSIGPNNNLIDEGSVDWVGDIDLEQTLNLGTTYNATVLEFDFIPLTSYISFDYIFASEEYQGNAPCQYSDGFAFLLKPVGSSGLYQNLALIPNTDIPVLVTTVHPAVPNCGAENEAYFGSYNDSSSPINFNGQTVVMTAEATVIPGVAYHIKLVIADEENIRYDSAIFLGGGSFNVGTDIGPDQLFITNNPVCAGETYLLDATESGTNTYQWYKDGAILNGETNALYNVNSTGDYSVEVNLGGSGCIAEGEITIEYSDLPQLIDPVTIVQCDENNDGVSIFDLTSINNIVAVSSSPPLTFYFYENLSDAQNTVNPITNPTEYLNFNGSSVVVRAENQYGCANFSTINLQIANNSVAAPEPVYNCDTDGTMDGFSLFDLSAQVSPQLLSTLPAGLTIDYYLSASDALLESNTLANAYSNTSPMQQIIYGRITNGPDCYGIIPVTLIVRTFNPENFDDETIFICPDGIAVLSVQSGFTSYLWTNIEDGGSTVTVESPGTYLVTVTDEYGCSVTKTFFVVASEIATVTSINVADFAGNENTVTVNVIGSGNYEYSIDGVNYQPDPIFTNITAGEYNVFVNDINGCGTSLPFNIFVMDYPLFFTPNGDGFNDVWEVKYLASQPLSKVFIFDRFGKLLHNFSGSDSGWNGKMNNVDLPSTDYWFSINLEDGREVKSHFTLKR